VKKFLEEGPKVNHLHLNYDTSESREHTQESMVMTLLRIHVVENVLGKLKSS